MRKIHGKKKKGGKDNKTRHAAKRIKGFKVQKHYVNDKGLILRKDREYDDKGKRKRSVL